VNYDVPKQSNHTRIRIIALKTMAELGTWNLEINDFVRRACAQIQTETFKQLLTTSILIMPLLIIALKTGRTWNLELGIKSTCTCASFQLFTPNFAVV
jgi:hypothetical protein